LETPTLQEAPPVGAEGSAAAAAMVSKIILRDCPTINVRAFSRRFDLVSLRQKRLLATGPL
jgi:hypothetical protein